MRLSQLVILSFIILPWLIPSQASSEQTIKIHSLQFTPLVDGLDTEWHTIPFTTIPLDNKFGISEVFLKGGVKEDEVFFIFQWKDSTEDIQHKPFIWDNALGKYVVGKEREDRFSINFAMEGDFTANWISGKTFTADMWHWKAFRTNTLGLAHDKMTIITDYKPAKKAYEGKAENGKTVYFQRPADFGKALYTTRRYATRKKDVMPKYILNTAPSGSVADVKAKGVWQEGKWTLEMKRKLNTGNPDDVVFEKGKEVKAAIAAFDHNGDDKHDVSQTLIFQF